MSHTNRIILLIDMDCFYCQVEENLNPVLKGKPIAVVQYNQWRGGGIIAVNYPARDKGVTRHMRGDDAKRTCPEIALVKVPDVRGKADLSKYREAGKRVANVLQTFTTNLERASVDEAYLDITNIVDQRIQDKNDHVTLEKLPNTFVVGNNTTDFIENVMSHRAFDENNFKLALGGVIAEEIREEVFRVTGYKCSAGVAHNKILAKLVCGLHKPNKQTILPHEAVPQLFESMPVKKITGLGGKFGDSIVEKLNIEYMGELAKFSQKELVKKFDEKAACFLYNIAKGIDTEPVNPRLVSKSIGCCKKFPGKTALRKKNEVEHWLHELAEEIAERLEKDFEENGRKARQMVVSFSQEVGDEEINSTKTHPLASYNQEKIFDNAFKIVQKNCLKDDGTYQVIFLGISVGNFQDVTKVKEITSFFKNMKENAKNSLENETDKKHHETISIDKRNEDEPSDDNNSIYSRTTEEGDIDDANLIYYQQVHPKSVVDQNTIIDISLESIDKGSIITSVEHEKCDVNVAPPTTSFFSKYFNDNVESNVKTSNNSHLLSDSISTNNDNPSETNDNSKSAENTTNNKTKTLDDNSCPQCGKVIMDSVDYQEHLDYHFAISIVKNEAHLYRSETKQRSSSSSPIKKGSKKKSNKDIPTSSQKPIGDYFKANRVEEVEEEGAKDTCKECNKRVALAEWDIHTDFHAAKKLHLEMNVNQTKTGTKRKSVKDNKFKGQKDIIEFFKS